MHKGLRSAMLIAGSVIAIEVLAADTGRHSEGSFGVHSYCIRLLGEHGVPVGSKAITVSTDDEARELAAQYLNEYDKDLSGSGVAFPFIVVEGHPCEESAVAPAEAGPSSLAEDEGHHHRHHHRHVKPAAASGPSAK